MLSALHNTMLWLCYAWVELSIVCSVWTECLHLVKQSIYRVEESAECGIYVFLILHTSPLTAAQLTPHQLTARSMLYATLHQHSTRYETLYDSAAALKWKI